MNLSLEEIESMTGVGRCQISRYAADGRITRISQGVYDSASLANLVPPFNPRDYINHHDEERELWVVREKYAHRRELASVLKRRRTLAHTHPHLDTAELAELDKATKDYIKILLTSCPPIISRGF
jgi:hypothetical protein